MFKSGKLLNYLRQPLEVRLLRYLLMLALAIPTIMFIAWIADPGLKRNIFILNKTVSSLEAQNRASLFWVLNNEKIRKPNGERYRREQDYYGFFPQVDRTFTTRDIGKYSQSEIDSLADTLDAVYVLDTYGVYANEYFQQKTHPNHLLYGGLYKKDLDLLSAMKSRGKLIVTEFNMLGESTPANARYRFLKEFDLQWTGWSGRYFDSLDSLSGAGIPEWIFQLQRKKTGRAWPYKHSGVILVSSTDDIIVLESGDYLQRKVPRIETRDSFMERFQLPKTANYISWFDIVYSTSNQNLLLATFHLPVTPAGETLLSQYGLSPVFPAILSHEGADYQFYYFAGDFSDNQLAPYNSYLKGVHWFQSLLFNPENVLDRRAFFWQYYRPLVASIFSETP